jgi:hypothetical protein
MRRQSKIILAAVFGAAITLIAYPIFAILEKTGDETKVAVTKTTWGKIKEMYNGDPPPPPPPPPPPKE